MQSYFCEKHKAYGWKNTVYREKLRRDAELEELEIMDSFDPAYEFEDADLSVAADEQWQGGHGGLWI